MKIFKLIRQMYRTPWLLVEMLYLFFCFPVNILILLIWRIEFQFPISIYGLPLIIKATGSQIKFGKNLEMKNSSLANQVGINHRCCIATYEPEAKIIIGDNFGISGGSIVSRKLIRIGNNVMVGANCLIVDNDFHPILTNDRRYSEKSIGTKEVVINNNVFIGANSIILKGCLIGENSVIGAGSVVTGTIPSNVVAAGNPAKVIKYLKN